MTKSAPPLNYVRSFECAARHLSFTRAAAELGLTQAAVSMHIRSLEKHLGRDLFQRFPRSLKLTDAGEAYLPSLREALLMIDAATQTVQISQTYKTVIIAAPISFAENWLVPRIAAFNREFGDIEIVIRGTLWTDPEEEDANISIEMYRHDTVPSDGRLLRDGELTLICAPEDAHRITCPENVWHMPKVVVQGRHDYWLEYAAELQMPALELKNAIRTNVSNIALELVSRRAGVTVLPVDLARTYLDRNLLVAPLPQRPRSPWGFYIRETKTSNLAAAKTLMRWLLAAD